MPNITKPLNMTEKYKIQKHIFTWLPWHDWEIDFSWENDVIWHLDPPPLPQPKQKEPPCPEKYIFSELSRSIFQISLKYIKLVIPKILFILILVLCNFTFYFKIPPVTKIKISDVWLPPAPLSKDFSEVVTPPPSPIYCWEKLTFSKIYGKVNFSKRRSEMH